MKLDKKENLLDRWLLLGEMARDKRLNDAARRIAWFLLNRVNKDTGKADLSLGIEEGPPP